MPKKTNPPKRTNPKKTNPPALVADDVKLFCYEEDRSDWEPPSSKSHERDRARDNRKRYIRERNEVLAVLTRIWESHLMPPSGVLSTTKGKRMVVCIHAPAGLLCWPVDVDEVQQHFAHLEQLPKSHWDNSKAVDRTERLQLLASTPRLDPIPVIGDGTPRPAPMFNDQGTAMPVAPEVMASLAEQQPRRPGEFHKPRTKETR